MTVIIDPDTGRYMCCSTDAYSEGFHAARCPNTPHEGDLPECPHCGQRYDLTGGCDGDKPECHAITTTDAG